MDKRYKGNKERKARSHALLVFILVLIILPVFSTLVSSFYIPKKTQKLNFMVVAHDQSSGTLRLVKANSITKENYSPIIPRHLYNYRFSDSDTQFSVLTNEQGKQVIELTYELALLNHPHILYSANENRITELWNGFGTFITFIFAVVLAIFEKIFKFTGSCRNEISEFGYMKGSKVIFFNIFAFFVIPLAMIVLLQINNIL